MARRPRILMGESSEPSDSRSLHIPRELTRAAIAVVLLLVAGFSSAGARFLAGEAGGDARLAQKNAALEAELAQLRSQVDTLRSSLAELADKDEYFRLLAGLDPTEHSALELGEPVEVPDGDFGLLRRVDSGAAQAVASISTEIQSLLDRARVLSFSWREAKDTLQGRYDRLASTPSILPTNGYLSSVFSHRRMHPILSRPRPHLGVDIVARRGTPIVAAAKGRVRYVGFAGEYGLTIEIDHGYGYATRYAHASRALVRIGQPVERGDMIGRVGDTGLAVGPHLHYEVLVNERQANPRWYITEAVKVTD